MITIDIEIKKCNPIKEFFHRLYSHPEDMLFSIIQEIPEKYIPCWLMEWLSRYLDKRISELKHQFIKITWQDMYLQSALMRSTQGSRIQKKHLQMISSSVGASQI